MGNLFVLRDRGPLLSRSSDCTGVVAVFGHHYQRTVLRDMETFGLPRSAAYDLNLPPALVNLNRSLHSMTSQAHADHKQLLAAVLNAGAEAQWPAVREVRDAFVADWRLGASLPLLDHMRSLTHVMASRLLFGGTEAESLRLASLASTYFHLRREITMPARPVTAAGRRRLIVAGTRFDDALRARIRVLRRAPEPGGILSHLVRETRLSDDEIVGHSNILFISSSEPIAVALTWIVLLLSQRPRLRHQLRTELGAGVDAGAPLLDAVIHESLRLLPPNAFMVRMTTRPVVVDGMELPAQCEVVLCPFLSHRDPEWFPRPHAFQPQRWRVAKPSHFIYFPFGAGGHTCVGRSLGLSLIKDTLACLLRHCDLVLAHDQDIDWRIHVLMMPDRDPIVRVGPPTPSWRSRSGRLGGQVGILSTRR